MKKITAKEAERLSKKLGLSYGADARTFYATNEDETEVWEFDSKKARDEFLYRISKKEVTTW